MNEITKIDVNPSKRIYHPIISDYDFNKAICELVDNTIDYWVKNGKKEKIVFQILFDEEQQTLKIFDNAGGVKFEDLKLLVAPGHTSNNPTDETIGIFGVGSKRAVVHLAERIQITTHHIKDKTYRLIYDNEWLEKEDQWKLPVYDSIEIPKGRTEIELTMLRYGINSDHIKELFQHLGEIYSIFLENEDLEILINDQKVTPINFEKWAFPPEYRPKKIPTKLFLSNGQVNVEIRAGLSTISSPATGEYGVYFYCNHRLISKSLKDSEVGYMTGLIGMPHPNVSIVRVFVYLNGPSNLMPWNSSKSAINYNHIVFKELKRLIIELTKHYSKISRNLEGKWPQEVFPYDKGQFDRQEIQNIHSIGKIRLPEIPIKRFSFSEDIIQKNKSIGNDKPWTIGLYESIAASDIIFKKSFSQKNRISLIILDSTLEIGLKDYLVNESGEYYNNSRLANIFESRHKVINEVKKYTANNEKWEKVWKKVDHYYRLRNTLIHQRSDIKIEDEDVIKYKELVEKILRHLFGLKF